VTVSKALVMSALSPSAMVCTDGSRHLSTACAGSAAHPAPATTMSGTTASLGGSSLAVGTCASAAVPVANSTMSMAVVATPAAYPGDGFYWRGYVSANGTVTVKVCAAAAGTPMASTYNVRVLQ
jgi:hypothetical protein